MTEHLTGRFESLPPRVHEQLGRWRIHLGIPLDRPLKEGRYSVAIPDEPHIFYCGRILLYTGNNPTHSLNDVMVIHGHGVVLGSKLKDWVWRGSRKPIAETVRVYESIAREFGLPHIDIILSCRDSQGLSQPGARVIFESRVGLPYIVPDAVVYQSIFPGLLTYYPGEGVREMHPSANVWYGIDRWLRIRQPTHRNRAIPRWARSPVRS